MPIDLDITLADWDLEKVGDRGADSPPFLAFNSEDDVIATLCVPQFKAVADAAEIAFMPTIKRRTHDEQHKYDCLTLAALEALKARIKELKDG